jgi:hypothetical protein
MRITKVLAAGLKGGEFAHEIGPLTVFVGRNFTGKTARLDAVRLGLAGYVPELGKTNVATMQLADDSALTTILEFDDGGQVERTWITKKGKTACEIKSNRPAWNEAIAPPVLIDPSVYFGLGDKDRIRYVFGLVNMEETVSGEQVSAAVKNIRLADNTEATEKVLRSLVEEIDKSDYQRHDQEQSIQTWLETLIADFRDRVRLGKQSVDRLTKTAQGIVVLKAADTEQTMGSVEAQLKAARERKSELDRKAGEIDAQLRRLQQALANRKVAEAKLAGATSYTDQITALTAEITKAQEQGGDYTSQTGPLNIVLDQSIKRRAEVEAQYKAIACQQEKAINDSEAIEHLDACPHCGARGKGWRSHLLAKQNALVSEYDGLLRSLQPRMDEARAEVAKAMQDLEVSRKVDAVHQEAATALNRLLSERARLTDLQRVAEQAKTILESLGPATEEAAMATLEQDRITVEQSRVSTLTAIGELEARQRSWHQSRQDEARMAQAILAQRQAEVEVTVLVEAVKVLEKLQVEMVAGAFKAILEVANSIAEPVLGRRLEYRDGEIGAWRGATWVTHKTFSGTEKAVAYAAISVSLASQSPTKLVMIDELGRLDTESKAKLMGVLAGLVKSGQIDQFIGVDTSGQGYGDEVTVIKV